MRWDGAVAILEVAKRFTGRKYGVEHGDLIEATIDEIVLKGLSHRRHQFNFGVPDTNAEHGFSHFGVDAYDGT